MSEEQKETKETKETTDSNKNASKIEQLETNLEKVSKRHKLASKRNLESVDLLLKELRKCKSELFLQEENKNESNEKNSAENTTKQISIALEKLEKNLKEANLIKKVNEEHKDYHSFLSKFGKLIEKSFHNNIEQVIAVNHVEQKDSNKQQQNSSILKEMIVQHLFRMGLFEIGEKFINESSFSQNQFVSSSGNNNNNNNNTSSEKTKSNKSTKRKIESEEDSIEVFVPSKSNSIEVFVPSKSNSIEVFVHSKSNSKKSLTSRSSNQTSTKHNNNNSNNATNNNNNNNNNNDLEMEEIDSSNNKSQQQHRQTYIELRKPFEVMHKILEDLEKNKNVKPIMEWAIKNRNYLSTHQIPLEWNLHKLNFVLLLKQDKRDEALLYARTNFGEFAHSQIEDIKKLSTCLLFVGRIEESPYSGLISSPNLWNEVIHQFTSVCCSMLGLSFESALWTTTTAGSLILPKQLKLSALSKGKFQNQPIEFSLPDQFRFHSIFACPVSKEQTTEENPPFFTSCGHVISKNSMQKLSRNNTTFKCPYCPSENVIAKATPFLF